MIAFRLSKLHATGNDFLAMLVARSDDLGVMGIMAPQARAFFYRHTGAVCDGLIVVHAGRRRRRRRCRSSSMPTAASPR